MNAVRCEGTDATRFGDENEDKTMENQYPNTRSVLGVPFCFSKDQRLIFFRDQTR